MPNWPINPQWTEPSTFNGGKEYNAFDGVTFDDMNAIINNLMFLRNSGGLYPAGTLDIVDNGIYDIAKYAQVNVNVPQQGGGDLPQLHAPAVTLVGSVLSITNPASNGDFVTGYKIYANDAIVATITDNQFDLSTLQLAVGSYTIKVTAEGNNFKPSDYSNTVSYEVSAATIDGKYKWHDTIPAATWTQLVNFVSDNVTYMGMHLASGVLYYIATDGTTEVKVYDNGWVSTSYKTIDFGATSQTVSAIFAEYVATNADKFVKLTTPTNIEVDNSTVSFEADEHATSFEFVIDNTSWGDVAK